MWFFSAPTGAEFFIAIKKRSRGISASFVLRGVGDVAPYGMHVSFYLRCGEVVTDGEEKLDSFVVYAAVKGDGEPMVTIHMVGREDALFLPHGVHDFNGTFEVDNVNGTLFFDTQFRFWDGHHNAKPLTVFGMAKDGDMRLVRKGIVRGDAIGV